MRVTLSKRIVVGLSAAGKSTAVEIGPTPLHELDPIREGIDETTWGADVALLAHHSERAFVAVERDEWAVEPSAAGAVFRIINFPAHSKVELHTTDTIDVGIVLSGEIWLLLEDGEVLLQEHDVSVLHGEMHGWENRSDYPCRKFAVLVSTVPPEEW